MSLEVSRQLATKAARKRLAFLQGAKRRWANDLSAFCGEALTIRPKGGAPKRLTFNSVQQKLDRLLNVQKAQTGRVRAVIVKARQLGISTYVGARFYHRARHNPGYRSLVMTHRDDATRNLMGMVRRYHDDAPSGGPKVTLNNASEIVFDNEAGFMISTAGAVSTGAGRSFTFQLAHLSELAFWQNASDHLTAVLDAVPDVTGSEIIIESTANGTGGPFHALAMAAMGGGTDYQIIFLPWFEHEEYAETPPTGWVPGVAVRELAERFGLSAEKLYWAERKNADRASVDGDPTDALCWRFRQEYPSTPEEAFRASRRGGFIPASIVAMARARRNVHQPDAPLILGCDFATGGGGLSADRPAVGSDMEGSEDGDSNVFVARRGRVIGKELFERFVEYDTLTVANRLQAQIDRLTPDRVFMDRGGGGAAVFDILCARGYGLLLELVDFGTSAKAVDQRKYRNRRAEMHGDFRDWLQDGDIPDDDLLETEITAPWVKREDEMGLLLAPKREIRQKLGMSPDGLDACVLTLAAPVNPFATEPFVVGGSAR